MQICPSATILSNWGGLNPLINMKSQSICWPQKLSGGFPSHIFLPSSPAPSSSSDCLRHPQLLFSGVPGRSKRKAFFFFPLPHCASSLAFLFPLGRGCFLSWTCSKKGVRLAVPVRCCPWSLYKGSCTKQGWQAVTHRDPYSRVEKLVPGMLFLLRNLKTEERSVTHWKCVLSVTFAVCFFFSPL